ncbi:baseplate J/gp47 family protein [Citrobacter braakii]|uniref:baseplate J/gp47 family protein n=1 Tax=Citrobacter braakii TaxID=57706 RepID=UPI004039AB18
MQRFPDIPAPELVDVDDEAMLARVKQQYYDKTGHYPDTNDPETFELEQLTYEAGLIKDDINRSAQQNLLAYANDAMLDNIGLLVGATRLPASSASAAATVTLKAGHPDFVLAAGYTVLASDGQTSFVTATDYAFSASMDEGEITLVATDPGVAGNGFLPGEITQAVTPNDWIIAVSNTGTTQGGADTEDDESFAERIFLAPSQFSVAGPYDAYKFWVLSTSAAISDASVESPEPNDIVLYAVLEGGVVPDEPMKAAILDTCSARNRRPLGDRVSVGDAEAVEASGEIRVEIYKSNASLAAQIEDTVRKEADALAYKWGGKLGRDIIPQAFIAIGQKISGVYRCTTTLEEQRLNKQQFPLITITAVDVVLVDEEEV